MLYPLESLRWNAVLVFTFSGIPLLALQEENKDPRPNKVAIITCDCKIPYRPTTSMCCRHRNDQQHKRGIYFLYIGFRAKLILYRESPARWSDYTMTIKVPFCLHSVLRFSTKSMACAHFSCASWKIHSGGRQLLGFICNVF